MEVGKMPAESKTNQSQRLTAAGLIAVTAATLLMMGWAILPTPAVGVPGNCPTGAPWVQQNGSSGSANIGGGVTISWSGKTVTVSGGSATICVKAGNNNSGVLTDFGPGTYTLTCAVFGCNPQGMLPGISHVQWIPVTTTTTTTATTTTTTTTPTTTTTTPTTTTTTTASPTVGPTTIHKSTTTTDTVEVLPTTVTPGGTAFTGVEDVVPIGALALMLMTSGTGLMWAGARRRRQDGSGDEN